MVLLRLFIFLEIFSIAGLNPSPSSSPLPFWKTKPEVYKRLKEDRAIIVSAKDEIEADKRKLTINTAGLIHAPEDFVFNRITEYEKYPDFVSYIKETSYDKTTKNLFVHGAILGYHVRMTIHMEPYKTLSGHKLDWQSISGGFVGMKGSINQESSDAEHTEISMNAVYLAESLGIPAFILNWGLEYAARQACASIRTHIEDEWSESTKNH